MNFIDAHVHVWTPDTAAYPLAPGYEPAQMKPPSFTPEQLFAHCCPCGVDRVVLIQMSFYGYDNRYMVDAIAHWPDVFRGVAVIDHTQPDAPAVMESLRLQGVTGLRIQPRGAGPGTWLEDEHYRRMMATAGDLGMAVCPLIDPEYVPAVGRAAEAFPGTNFVVDHLGRVGASRPVQQDHVDMLCDLGRLENCHVKVSAFYALAEKKPPHDDLIPLIRQVWETYGADRLMWASDCPYQVQQETYEDGLGLVRDRLDSLPEADRAALLSGTAQRVFFGD